MRIKQQPEDFQVRELMSPAYSKDGPFSYYLLKKRSLTTLDAVQIVADRLRTRPGRVGFAGAKDRRAITWQHISLLRGPEKGFACHNLELTFLGRSAEPVRLGMHGGNSFEIVVRCVDRTPKPLQSIVNYFGSQRFGATGRNHLIGKALVRREFAAAVELIDQPGPAEHLSSSPKDFVGALRRLPKRLLSLYIHAYQSYLWNRLAEAHESDQEDMSLPLCGFHMLRNEEAERLLAGEGIKPEDFLFREMPEISSEGGERRLFAEVRSLRMSCLEADELNPGTQKLAIGFELGKGSYATEVIRQLFKEKYINHQAI